MRTRLFLLAASVTSLAAAALAQGCGETETTTSPADGGATDATTDVRREAAPIDEEDGAPPCDTTKDFTKEIPDADLGDGASSTGVCMACTKDNCQKYIDDCTKNCECQGIAAEALECYAKNSGDIIKCVGNLPSNTSKQTQATGFALFQCMSDNCKDECQTEQFNDGGADAAKDADAGQ
jgi:hypothetical protein